MNKTGTNNGSYPVLRQDPAPTEGSSHSCCSWDWWIDHHLLVTAAYGYCNTENIILENTKHCSNSNLYEDCSISLYLLEILVSLHTPIITGGCNGNVRRQCMIFNCFDAVWDGHLHQRLAIIESIGPDCFDAVFDDNFCYCITRCILCQRKQEAIQRIPQTRSPWQNQSTRWCTCTTCHEGRENANREWKDYLDFDYDV